MGVKKIKIVVADDNPGIRQTFTDLLGDEGYQVITVGNGYQLLDYLRENSADIVILDLMMPEKDGLETISILRSIAPDTKIIVYTAFGRYESSLYAKEADKFLLKTESPERVLKSIKDLVE
jgi:CheY-like chemotaxis protein